MRLSDDAELRALNARFLGFDEPTDVLAFPGDDWAGAGPRRRARVGDIAISVERALRQGDDPVAELRLLAVHGLLHCVGHDHADAAGARRMTAATRRLLPLQMVPELTTS
ncbi:MAG: rRNA maturation RNase YbeY [Candidatus Dormibacteraeota bacterium]|nr:rRNA maturation RNase YbeY [Candidatus Dormibacteraeota bacterium]